MVRDQAARSAAGQAATIPLDDGDPHLGPDQPDWVPPVDRRERCSQTVFRALQRESSVDGPTGLEVNGQATATRPGTI